MKTGENIINWFEIPTHDILRAKKFYETVFDIEMAQMEMGGIPMAFFPMDETDEQVSGGLIQNEHYQPGHGGVVIYLNGNPDLSVPLSRVHDAGGRVVLPKTLISEEVGYMAFFMDTEGNKIALHSSL